MARRYARDNRGRFASSGSGATARGGRLKTAGGKNRATQTMKAKGGQTGTIGKPKGLKPGAIKPKAAAAKPAARPAAAKPARSRRAGIDDAKISRVISRVNAVARNDMNRTGVKALNATQVAVRAKSFLARKEGGNVGILNQKSQPEAFASVRKAMTKPPRYSTQKPNRNKPGRFNDLGQDKARTKARLEARTTRQKIQDADAAIKAKKAKVSPRRIASSRELLSSTMVMPPFVKGSRIKSTIAKPKSKPSSTVIRTRSQSKAAQRSRRELVLDRTRTGFAGMGRLKRNPGLKRRDTGMRQLSLTGPSKTLFSFKRTKLTRARR